MGHAVSTDQMRSLRKERPSTLSFEFQAHSRPWTKLLLHRPGQWVTSMYLQKSLLSRTLQNMYLSFRLRRRCSALPTSPEMPLSRTIIVMNYGLVSVLTLETLVQH